MGWVGSKTKLPPLEPLCCGFIQSMIQVTKEKIVQPMKSIMQRNSCKIMQFKTYEMGPALLPFASYKPLWASPRSFVGNCKATEYITEFITQEHKSKIIPRIPIASKRRTLTRFLNVQSRHMRAENRPHSGSGPHPSKRGEHHHLLLEAIFCLFVRRAMGVPPSPPFLHSNISEWKLANS